MGLDKQKIADAFRAADEETGFGGGYINTEFDGDIVIDGTYNVDTLVRELTKGVNDG